MTLEICAPWFQHYLDALVSLVLKYVVTMLRLHQTQAVCDHKGRIDLAALNALDRNCPAASNRPILIPLKVRR